MSPSSNLQFQLSINAHTGMQHVLVPLLGPLPPTSESLAEFLVPGFHLAPIQLLRVFVSHSLCLSKTVNIQETSWFQDYFKLLSLTSIRYIYIIFFSPLPLSKYKNTEFCTKLGSLFHQAFIFPITKNM